MAEVSLQGVHKLFGSVTAVEDFNLSIGSSEFVVFVGPSGCGKSTTLRMLAGLEDVSSGVISIDGKPVNNVHPKDRDIAMVFQNYALYPHLNVFDNISFGLRAKRLPKDEITTRTNEAADILGLDELLKRRPGELSGGQKQRVAMGRAIVRKPKVFLFDEPLSNLDAKLRHKMRAEMKLLHQRVKTTTVYVTHDQVEAMTLADRIVVFSAGRIEQIGAPLDLYENPANLFVATCIGSPKMNMLGAGALSEVGITLSSTRVPDVSAQAARFGIRPEHITLSAGAEPGDNRLVGEVGIFEKLGGDSFYHVDVAGLGTLVARTPPTAQYREGETVTLALDPSQLHAFGPDEKSLAGVG